MRRDLVYFYDRPLDAVYDAFVQAAKQKFGKNCKFNDDKSVSFGLNFSFKYNMNGGSMTLHFMPYQNGTAVNLRYAIVQAMGARYKAHARDFTLFVDDLLRTKGSQIQLDVNQFLAYEQNPAAFAPAPPVQPEMPAPSGRTCPKCGALCSEDARFCNSCGFDMKKEEEKPKEEEQPKEEEKQADEPEICKSCGATLLKAGKFCHRCGAKRG